MDVGYFRNWVAIGMEDTLSGGGRSSSVSLERLPLLPSARFLLWPHHPPPPPSPPTIFFQIR